MQKRSLYTLFIAITCLFLFIPAISSGASIKDRMAARIPVINGLKDQGAVGENNKGYLEFRGGNKPKADVVSAENTDRKKVYAAIGKKQGAKPELVGQRRAKQIADKGKKGHWFQSADGKWYKK